MSKGYARPLQNKDRVEDFLVKVLDFDFSHTRGIISKIVDSEIGVIHGLQEGQTWDKTELRERAYKDERVRWELRNRIVEELMTKKRLPDDDKIKLGKGGALPTNPVISGKQAFILTGLPASGKSFIAAKIAEEYGAVIIDSDFAKRKLPEYSQHSYGASIVHRESSEIKDLIFKRCLENEHNIIFPTIGYSVKQLVSLAASLKDNNRYDVHIILVYLPKREATIRAIYRYNKTKRYVPLGLIFDVYGNDPCMCYYFLRCHHQDLFATMGAISTNVPYGSSPICMDHWGKTPALNYPQQSIFIC